MDWNYIIKIAVFTVGVTSMLTQIVNVKGAKPKVFLTVLTGGVGGLLLRFFPDDVFMTFIGVSVAVVFYDSVFKMIERILKGAEQ